MYQNTIIIGNVGRDAELHFTPQGTQVCNFTVAVNKRTGKGEDRKETTTWFRITVWRDRAETAARFIKKGMKLMCEGSISASVFVDKDGTPRATLELTCDNFVFLSGAPDQQANGTGDHAPAMQSEGDHAGDPDSGDIPF